MNKILLLAVAIGISGIVAAQEAFEPPAWAYPLMDEGRGRGPDDGTLLSVPGSNLQRTQTQIDDPFNPPNWYPDEQPPMPEVVTNGRPPNVRACGQCHMLQGMGHPESSMMAGLPVNYVIAQMRDYKSGARVSLYRRHNSMLLSATNATDEEVRAAAEYYAQLEPRKWVTVIEVEMVPETYVGQGNMRHAEPDGGMEPIGERIIEIPEDSHLAERRDPHSPFIAYVPPGSIAAGRELATTGAGRTIQCDICHGSDLKGLADVPGIAGMSPIYMARQLWDIKHGARTGISAALMLAVVANLTDADVRNVSAYIASLDP
jgi:cytochrome c553